MKLKKMGVSLDLTNSMSARGKLYGNNFYSFVTVSGTELKLQTPIGTNIPPFVNSVRAPAEVADSSSTGF